MFAEIFNQLRWEIIDILSLDIDLLLQQIDIVNQQPPETHYPLDEERKFLLCLHLRGYSQADIQQKYQSLGLTIGKRDISNKMRSVHAGTKKLTGHRDSCALLNYLLEHGYKIIGDRDNGCLSLGGRYFLSLMSNAESNRATQQFLLRNYDLALASFLELWDQEKDPETLIYLNNSWLLANQTKLQQEYGIASFKLYKIAVVIPVLYNNGSVARDLLRGIANLQLKINLALSRNPHLHYPLAELEDIKPFQFANRQKFGLLIYIAGENSERYSSNNTAISIKNINDILGVIGHYSSEATARALKTYATFNIPLVSASAAANNLSDRERVNRIFYRVTTNNQLQASTLAKYVCDRQKEAKLAIMYNANSDYCCSFKDSFLENFSGNFVLEYQQLFNNNYNELQEKIAEAQNKQVNIILLIPDGGINLGSLKIAGSIIRSILTHDCWLVGGASLIHQDTLEWVREASKKQTIDEQIQKIVISSPWFPDSTNNHLVEKFCREHELIWQQEIASWREGTAYDSALILAKAIDEFNSQTREDKSFGQILQQLKQNSSYFGVTGKLQFNSQGDRFNSPVKLLGIRKKSSLSRQRYYFHRL